LKRFLVPLAAVLAVALLAWTSADTFFPALRAGGQRTKLFVYGFSILAEPLRERIFPAFQDRWRRERGEEILFVDSFAASGTVANQVALGAPADVAILAHPGDADRIVEAGMARGWRDRPYGGVLNRTAIAIVVRPGNPRAIRSFADLARPGVRVVHPDPLTSGGAEWAVLAEYAAPLEEARVRGLPPDPAAAERTLAAIWRNVVAQAPSARAANMQFETGFGDALVTYEVEALLDARRGGSAECVVPETTILTEHPVVVVDRNVTRRERPAVEAFVRFLQSDEAQRAFAAYGYRSVLPGLDAANPALRPIPHAFTVAALGGWKRAREAIVERIWQERVLREGRR
jgi:sulfate transport system substrate-binding protein